MCKRGPSKGPAAKPMDVPNWFMVGPRKGPPAFSPDLGGELEVPARIQARMVRRDPSTRSQAEPKSPALPDMEPIGNPGITDESLLNPPTTHYGSAIWEPMAVSELPTNSPQKVSRSERGLKRCLDRNWPKGGSRSELVLKGVSIGTGPKKVSRSELA